MNLPSHLTAGQGSHDVVIAAYDSIVKRQSLLEGSTDKVSKRSMDHSGDAKGEDAPLADTAKRDDVGKEKGAIEPESVSENVDSASTPSSPSAQHAGPPQDGAAAKSNENEDIKDVEHSNVPTPMFEESAPLASFDGGKTYLSPSQPARSETHRQDMPPTSPSGPPPPPDGSRTSRMMKKVKLTLRRHVAFIGPGLVASVGYTDPGNWVTDLAAGSQFGYALLFVVLFSGLVGIFLQILTVRMGVVTGMDLARNTRLWLLPDDDSRLRWPARWSRNSRRQSPQPQHQQIRFRNARILTLWLLYFVSEAAIVATELAELLGSAIALNLLFPGLPLWGGVLVTCADVMVILFVYRPNGGNFRILEVFIAALVFIVLGCYIALLVRVKPHWPDVFHGYVPSSTLVQPQALYAGIGIIGAVIMPHALYLGSHFSTLNRINKTCDQRDQESAANEEDESAHPQLPLHQRMLVNLRRVVSERFPSIEAHLRHPRVARVAAPASSTRRLATVPSLPDAHETGSQDSDKTYVAHRMSIAEMRIHLPHAGWDIAFSLFFFAITVNSAILIVAAAAFYYGSGSRELSDLYDAFRLLSQTLGKAYAILFAVGLLAAGQSASITCTLSGQIVSEGFIRWRTNPFVRRLVTRLLTMIPAVVMAVSVGPKGLDQMLIASQVTLSFALPFVLVPLIAVTSMKSKMSVRDEVDEEAAVGTQMTLNDNEGDALPQQKTGHPFKESTKDVGSPSGKEADPSNAQSPTSADAILLAPATPHSMMATMRDAQLQRAATKCSTLSPRPTSSKGAVHPCDRGPPPSPPSIHSSLVANFRNHWAVIAFAVLVYVVILLADMYTLVTTIMGE